MKKIANFVIGLLIIFLILFLSKFIVNFTKFAFPAPVLGILVLFLLLKINLIKEKLVKDFCEFCLKYMILFFIPMFVGVINYFEIISKNLWAILLTIFITTALVIVFVGLFTYNVIKFQRLKAFRKRSLK